MPTWIEVSIDAPWLLASQPNFTGSSSWVAALAVACRIGDEISYEAEWVVSSSLPLTKTSAAASVRCRVSAPADVGSYVVAVSGNGGQDWSAGLSVQVIPSMMLLSVSPSLTPWTGGVNLTLYGMGFSTPFSTLPQESGWPGLTTMGAGSSMLGVVLTRGTMTIRVSPAATNVINDTALVFTLPDIRPYGVLSNDTLIMSLETLSTAAAGGSVATGELPLVLHTNIAVTTISPRFGSADGGTPLMLSLNIPSYGSVVNASLTQTSTASAVVALSYTCTMIANNGDSGGILTALPMILINSSTLTMTAPPLAAFSNNNLQLTPSAAGSNDFTSVDITVIASNGYIFPTVVAAYYYLPTALLNFTSMSPREIRSPSPAGQPRQITIYNTYSPQQDLMTGLPLSLPLSPLAATLNVFAHVRCMFDGTMVEAIRAMSTPVSVTCVAPPHTPGNVQVSVSVNQVDWTPIPTPLTYIDTDDASDVLSLYPSSGPLRGNSTVSIIGCTNCINTPFRDKAASLFCRFGRIEVPLRIELNRQATAGTSQPLYLCQSPDFSAVGSGAVELSVVLRHPMSKQGDVLETGLTFVYYEDVEVMSLSPRSGPSLGGSVLTIEGKGFSNTSLITVKFAVSSSEELPSGAIDNDIYVTATFVSSTSVIVVVPPCPLGLAGGVAQLTLSLNMVDYSDNSLALPFYWDASLAVTTISPIIVMEMGGTVLDISGEGFYPTYPNALWCRFGGQIVVDALYMTRQLIKCTTPLLSPGEVALEVTANGQDYVQAGTIRSLAAPALVAITPQLGTWRGGTVVNITVINGFSGNPVAATAMLSSSSPSVGNNSLVHCAFGLGRNQMSSVATIVSDTLVQCRTPSHAENISASVAFSLNLWLHGAETAMVLRGQDQQLLTYQYMADVWAHDASLLVGPSVGGTTVQLYGQFDVNFAASLTCRFGDYSTSSSSSPAAIVPAVSVSETVVICITPPMLDYPDGTVVPISLSYNNQDVVYTGLLFEFYPTVTMLSLSPDFGPSLGGTSVHIYGSGFVPGDATAGACVFGGQAWVKATYINAGEIVCVAPPSITSSVLVGWSQQSQSSGVNQGAAVTVAFSHNGYDLETTTSLSYTYVSGPGVVSLSPPSGTINGGTTIIITTLNFESLPYMGGGLTWYCAFGDNAVVATTRFTDSMSCITPPGE